jgi:2-hydroxy-3-keto-5-methylthiopentenyl-1-phosphate phosphatase
VLLVLDFDGTVTDEDLIDVLVHDQSPEQWDRTETALQNGEMTLNDALVAQLAGVRATEDEVVRFLEERATLRPGLPELIGFCRERFIEPVVISSGFHEVIEPILRRHGIDVPVVAHHAAFSPDGATITFLERAACETCNEACKRADALRLADGRPVAYVGDGVSDRCAAAVADIVFARAALARYLERDGVPFLPFDDFGDVQAGLAAYLAGR